MQPFHGFQHTFALFCCYISIFVDDVGDDRFGYIGQNGDVMAGWGSVNLGQVVLLLLCGFAHFGVLNVKVLNLIQMLT